MVEQLKIYETPILAIEIIEGFTKNDYELVQKWAEAKREKGFAKANLLIKLDKLKISDSSIKVVLEQIVKLMKNFKQLGRIAIVAESNIVKKVVQIDNFFLKKFSNKSEERYFDVKEMEEAFTFIEVDING